MTLAAVAYVAIERGTLGILPWQSICLLARLLRGLSIPLSAVHPRDRAGVVSSYAKAGYVDH